MNQNIYVIEGKPRNWKEALRRTSKVLLSNNCVTESFFDSCVRRELEFPTGLNTLLPVAIPHTDDGDVLQTSICLLRLKKPVMFHSMECVENKIEVSFVLNLAINNGGAQLYALQRIISIFQDESFKNIAFSLSLDELQREFEKLWTEEQKTSEI